MVKRIQAYLLTNYPLLWNLKIVPVGFAIIGINFLFFIFGFITTGLHEYDTFPSYMVAVLTSVLVLIIWLIQYLKNNAFKVFYYKTLGALYTEWLLLFILLSGIVLFSFSFDFGRNLKKEHLLLRNN